ncbi:GAF domain-containing protein, partial [Myxococcus xanthus]
MSRALERLSAAPPVVAVLEELLCQASATLGASGAFLCWWGGTGDLSTLTTHGVDAEAAAIWAQQLLAQAPAPGEPRLPRVVEDVSRDALLASEPDALRRLGATALLSQPLFFASGLGAAGVLGVLFREPWRPREEDVRRFGLSVKLAALALERERMAETLRQSVLSARAEVEESEVLRLRRFQAVTEALGGALSSDEVARVVLEQGLPAVGAGVGLVYLGEPDGTLALKAALGVSNAQREALRVPPWRSGGVPGLGAGGPVRLETPAAARDGVPVQGAPVWLETPAAARDVVPVLGALRALVLLPLQVEGHAFGTLCLGFSESRRFSVLERASITGLGHACGQALERARLYARERTARLQAEAAGQRLRLLADASALVSASLDWEETVAGVARLALGHFADGCAVDSYEDGVVRRLAVLYENPQSAPRGLELLRFAPQEGSPTLLAEVLASGRPWMMARPTAEPGDTSTAAARLYAAARELGVGSLILTPLVARQRTLGVLTFMRSETSAPFDIPDLSLAEELAGRAALAIDNADLFRKARAAEEESRRGAARLHVLVQVSHLIAEAGLDLPMVLEVLVRKVSEALGDACVLQLLSEDTTRLELVTVHHPNAEARAVLDASMRRCPGRVG